MTYGVCILYGDGCEGTDSGQHLFEVISGYCTACGFFESNLDEREAILQTYAQAIADLDRTTDGRQG